LTAVLLLFVCLSVSAQGLSHEEPLLTNSQWRDSLRVLNKAIADSAWSTDLHLRKAAVNLELKQWQYAAEEYSLVLQRETQNPAALFFRGYAHTHLRRYDQARSDYQSLLALFPRHFEARLSLAYVLQQQGKKTDALDQLNQLVEMHKDSALAYASRANMEQELKLWDAALYDLQEATRLEPHDAGYVGLHADLLISLQRKKEAKQVLDRAVSRGIPRGLLDPWYQKIR
jgi:tetratricopeptide (TPR) repeat protein